MGVDSLNSGAYKLQRKITAISVTLCIVVMLSNIAGRLMTNHETFLEAASYPGVWAMIPIAIVLLALGNLDRSFARFVQATLFVILSAPVILDNPPYAFSGLWFVLTGAILYYKYGFLAKRAVLKSLLLFLWTMLFLILNVVLDMNSELSGALDALFFSIGAIAFLFFAFEEEIRNLKIDNAMKDEEIEEKDEKIAEMEPLSVLGERLSYVVHSFKNNMNQISQALYMLEENSDAVAAAQKLHSYTTAMMDRIDNVLMLSKSGKAREPEEFDLGRLLDGIRFIYVQEKIFLENASVDLIATPQVMVRAIKWDVILMIENLVRNALEAIIEKGRYGRIKMVLTHQSLTVENDGGEIPLCAHCSLKESCLECPTYGKLGFSTKRGGNGVGLSQIFSVIEESGWDLKIAARNGVTSFTIRLSPPVHPVDAPTKKRTNAGRGSKPKKSIADA